MICKAWWKVADNFERKATLSLGDQALWCMTTGLQFSQAFVSWRHGKFDWKLCKPWNSGNSIFSAYCVLSCLDAWANSGSSGLFHVRKIEQGERVNIPFSPGFPIPIPSPQHLKIIVSSEHRTSITCLTRSSMGAILQVKPVVPLELELSPSYRDWFSWKKQQFWRVDSINYILAEIAPFPQLCSPPGSTSKSPRTSQSWSWQILALTEKINKTEQGLGCNSIRGGGENGNESTSAIVCCI